MSVLVKICGVTRLDDALAAVEAGADAVGFMLYAGSKRAVSAEQAGDIGRQLPAHIRRVGVFVNATAEEVRQAVAASGVDTLQFHGDESPEFCRQFRPHTLWKALRVGDRASLDSLRGYATDAWLLDSYVPGTRGGTGVIFNWDLAVLAQGWGTPIVLAGGLTPDTVAGAVQWVRPYAVDVSSGVEASPGRKDPAKVRAFVQAVRSAERTA